ncbi:MAG: LysR family transcriptional regulator [Bdellovibrionota bacterium]
MELNHLRYFYEVALSGSFTAAAQRLNISQSALSKAVALLESHEGVTLFERSKKGVTLTAVGTEVFQQSERLFKSVTDIENTLRGRTDTCEGPLSIGASDHVTNYFLLKALAVFQEKHPAVLPSVFSGAPNEIVAQLLGGKIEFGLFFTHLEIPGVSYEPLNEIEMVVVCHPRFEVEIAKTGGGARVKALVKKIGYISSIRSQYRHQPSQNLIELLGENPNVVFESNSQETQRRACLDGRGVAFLARFMVAEDLGQGRLVEVAVPKPLKSTLLLARNRERPMTFAARSFLELLRQTKL